MDTKNKIIIGLVILIALLLLYFLALPVFQEKYYTQGYNAGIQNVVSSISNTGNIPILTNGTVQQISIAELCKRIE